MSQAVIWTVPNLARAVVDNSAGTFTFQTYDSGSSSYVTQWTMSLSSGAITTAEGQILSKSLTVDGTSTFGTPVKNNSATKDVTGTTAGSFTWVMPEQGAGMKTVLVYFNGYENDTSTAQKVTYPTAFTKTPAIDNSAGVAGLSTDTTQLTINPDNTTKYTGWVKVWGL